MKITIAEWIRLRYLVALVGEYYTWWPKIISGNGEEFLKYVLPKTKGTAVHQLATEICRLEHDKNIGPSRYHIFRLPQKWEEKIFHELKNQQENLKVLT